MPIHKWIRERFLRYWQSFLDLPQSGKTAVLVTLAAVIIGLVFGLFAPHLTLLRRASRVIIDLLILIGLLAFLEEAQTAERAKPKRLVTILVRIEKVIVLALTLVAIALIVVLPDIDPWLRGYRLCLAIVLIVALLYNVRRPLPKRWFATIIGAQVIFSVFELALALYITLTVDGTMLLAAMKHYGRVIARQLETQGVTVPSRVPMSAAEIASLWGPQMLVAQNGRLFAGPLLHDYYRVSGGDLAGASVLLGRDLFADPRNLLLSFNHGAMSDKPFCSWLIETNPPLLGYNTSLFALEMPHEALTCATFTHNVRWHQAIVQEVADSVMPLAIQWQHARATRDCKELERVQKYAPILGGAISVGEDPSYTRLVLGGTPIRQRTLFGEMLMDTRKLCYHPRLRKTG